MFPTLQLPYSDCSECPLLTGFRKVNGSVMGGSLISGKVPYSVVCVRLELSAERSRQNTGSMKMRGYQNTEQHTLRT